MNKMSKQEIDEVKSRSWDVHDMVLTPHLVYPVLELFKTHAERIAGITFENIYCYIKNKEGRWAYDEDDLFRVGKMFFDNPDKMFQLSKKWSEYIGKFEKIIEQINNLEKLSSQELCDIYKRFYLAYMEEFSIPLLANAYDFYFQRWLREKVTSNEDYLALVAPSRESFTQRENRELFAIRRDSNFIKNIEKHAKKYFWLLNSYADTKMLDAEYFIHKYETEEYWPEQFLPKEKLIEKYEIKPEHIHAAEEAIFWRDERKMYNMIGDHYLVVLLNEIGRREGISLEDMKYVLPSEIGKADIIEIERRKNAILMLLHYGKIDLFTGDEAIKLKNEIFPEEIENILEVNGTPACLGIVTGRARIILRPQDFCKFQEGEVLITYMTRPDFVPLMKMAAAIVTEEGGITCHAAIVSRELRKPCVIGTKIATKVFKDGDMVEVDADRGIVRRA
jgi:phosphohistidine swiveling domain-containing protein